MAPFFLPSPPGTPAGTEDAYQLLREQAEALTGSVSRDRRIQEIECRHHGLDSRLCVGECDAANGQTVAAIVQLGRDTFTVHHVTAEHLEAGAPMVLARTEVYSVTDFD
jgi:hypothetical protein